MGSRDHFSFPQVPRQSVADQHHLMEAAPSLLRHHCTTRSSDCFRTTFEPENARRERSETTKKAQAG